MKLAVLRDSASDDEFERIAGTVNGENVVNIFR